MKNSSPIDKQDEAQMAAEHFSEGLKILAGMIAKEIIKEQRSDRVRTIFNAPPSTSTAMSQEKLTLSVSETAKRLGVGRNTIYELIRTQQIPSLRFGKRILVPRLRLEETLGQKSL